MNELDKNNTIELLKKLQDPQISDEEKTRILKMVNASVKEFNQLLQDLNQAIKEDK